MSVRILHTADWQLGKLFQSIEGDVGALLRQERWSVIERIAKLAVDKQVHAILVAGDVFEFDHISDASLHRFVESLAQHRVPWVLIGGNHDPMRAHSLWTRMVELGLPQHIHIAQESNPLYLENAPCVILPAPLRERIGTGDPTEYFDNVETRAELVRIGLAHGAISGVLPGSTNDRFLINNQRAESARLDYFALGDWHGTYRVNARTWYSGTPERDRFKDNDAGNVLLVEIAGPGVRPEVEKISVGRFRWRTHEADIRCSEDIQVLLQSLASIEDAPESLLQLVIRGSIAPKDWNRLLKGLERTRSRFCYLDFKDGELSLIADEALELNHDVPGFVTEAAQAIQAIAHDSDHPEHDYALSALRLLYTELQRETAQ